ncbi:MAG: IPT/TIG domain-containing protein [Actinobacteria bacterium]|nr:IPT/TIG domain-containing protein [Actinomycetota bacterium]
MTGIDGIPSNATAVVINVTALNMTTSGYFSIYSEGATPAVVSSLNWTANSGVVTNLVTVPVNTSNGEIVIANGGTSGTVNYVVDIEGYYTPPSSTPAGLYNAVTPTRLADSRCSESPLPTGITSSYCSTIPSANGKLATLGPGETENVTVTGIGGIPFSGVSAVVLNLTAIGPTSSGYLTAFPTGATKAEVSTVNFNKGETTPSRVIVKVGSNGQISIYNFSGNTNFAVDVSGYYTDGSSSSQTGSLFNPVTPARILDTRCSQSSLPVGITSSYCASLPSANATLPAIAGGKSIAVQVTGIDSIPSSATAVVGNLTATDGNGGGYLTIYGATTAPTTSDVNFATGTTNANMVISGLNSSGQVNIENGGESGSVNVLIDLAGYFIPAPPPAPAPTITSISPTSGPTAGGTSVTITGTNFTSSATVDFGSTAATSVTYNSATSLTATSPAESAGTVDVTVTTVGDTSATSSADQFTYTPYITNISPTTASMLSDVTLTGDGFGSSPGYVKLADLTTGTGWGAPGDGAYFYIVSWSNTQVVFQVPSDSGWWDNASWIPYSGDSMAVTIVSSGNTSNTVNFTIGSPNLYSYTSQSTATEYLGPGNNFTQEGSIASNTTVDLICQGTGQAVSDSSSPSGTSDIWDLTSAATWISDTTVNTTGVNEFTPPIPQCTGFITNPYPQNYTGYDISWPQCGSTSNYPPTPYTVNIVGVDSSPGSWNSCLSSEATWDTSSSSPLETYIVPASGTSSTVTGIDICGGNEYCRYGYETAQSAYQYATSILGSSTPSTWLLDVENYDIGSTPAWQSCSSTDTTACTDNIETIQGNLDFFIYNSMYVGLYSSPSEWSSITNDWSTLQGQFYVVGNWLAYYLQSSNNTAPSSCSTSVNSNYVPFSQGPLWLLQYGPTGGSSGDSWDGDISCYTN